MFRLIYFHLFYSNGNNFSAVDIHNDRFTFFFHVVNAIELGHVCFSFSSISCVCYILCRSLCFASVNACVAICVDNRFQFVSGVRQSIFERSIKTEKK